MLIANPCLLWTKAVDRNGYGRVGFRGKTVFAHRLAYAQHHGLDVFRMGGVVMHSCDNPACTEPSHLSMGTTQDNMRDRTLKLRTGSVLTADDVRAIRSAYVRGHKELGGKALAGLYGVTQACVSSLITGKTWSHV